jgi:hypothetical protein
MPEFPLGTWVRFTLYLHYEGDSGFVQVWQDGVPMLRADVVLLESSPGTHLQRAHWGMYRPPRSTRVSNIMMIFCSGRWTSRWPI